MSADVAEAVFYAEDSASPMTISKPAGASVNDLLVVVVADTDGALTDLTTPSGWTALSATVDIASQRSKAWSHVVAGGDPSSWDFPYNSGSAVAGVLFRVTGADTTPTIVSATANHASNGTTLDSPTVTPTGTDDLLICTISSSGNASAFSDTAPSGMTDLGKVQSDIYQAIAGAKLQLTSGSATGAKTWTGLSPTGRQCGTFSIAIKSASTAAYVRPTILVSTGAVQRAASW